MRALEAPRAAAACWRSWTASSPGAGSPTRSDTGGGFVAPRVLPEHRRRGVGSALLERLLEHVRSSGFDSAAAHAADAGCDRVRAPARLRRDRIERWSRCGSSARTEPAPPPYEGVVFTSVADDSTLLERAYAVASQGYADLALASGGITVPLDEWLRDEATLPGGSFAALDGDRVVGYAGLLVLERRRHESRARAHRGRPRVAAPRARDRAEAAAARLGGGKWDPRARHLDPDGERGHAERQRAARLRDADGEPHACGGSLCRSRTASRLPA